MYIGFACLSGIRSLNLNFIGKASGTVPLKDKQTKKRVAN